MKKLLSLILSICMLGSFAFSVSAADAAVKLDVTETADGATAAYSLVGSYSGINSIKVIVKYDAAKVTLEDVDYVTINDTWSDKSVDTTSVTGYAKVVYGSLSATGGDDYYTAENATVLTINFKKTSSDVTLAEGDIALADSMKVGRTYHYNEMYMDGAKSTLTTSTTFTAYSVTPSTPTITVDPESVTTGVNNGIVDITTNSETGAYSVNVTAPIGKVAVIYINGEPQTGSSISGTATADTTIKVAYQDATDAVITYVVPMADVYGEANGIVAFGKGTITDGDAYGIKFTGLTGTYAGITDGKFPATANVGGIFAVEVADAEAGEYSAQAFVNDTFGAVISFTK